MDRYSTDFQVLKEKGRIVGIKIKSAGNTSDETFCALLPQNLSKGKAKITVSDGKIHIKSIGIGGEEEWNFDLSRDEESQLQEILEGLGKNYQAGARSEVGFGRSFIADFKKILILNKKELNKRKRSLGRNPVPPKKQGKIPNWERIFT